MTDEQRTVHLPEEVARRADRMRGDVPLELFVCRAVEHAVIDAEHRAGLLSDDEAGQADMHLHPPAWRHSLP